MEVRTLKVEQYRGCNVYYRQIGSIFEYIAIINNEAYTTHIVVKKPFLRVIVGLDYTQDHLTNAVKFLKPYAESTIDFKMDEQIKTKAVAKTL